MHIEPKELHRFRLRARLSEGADSEVFAATDTHTGTPVVIKRPHPTLLARSQHDAVERRIARGIALRRNLGDTLPQLSRLIAYTSPANHCAYFADNLSAEYTVVVEQRACGVPLVGDAIDGIKHKPIGIPQNLFAVHPVGRHSHHSRFKIAHDVLKIAAAFHTAGAILLDCRPQNIYFAPKRASITLIDIGGITTERPASRRHPPVDLHDFYLELFKWYIPASQPPVYAEEYAQPYGMKSVPMFRQNLEAMIRRLTESSANPSQDAALHILRQVQARAYPDIAAFTADFEAFLSLLETQYAEFAQHPAMRQAWASALAQMHDPYWRKFQFETEDLSEFGLE